MLSMDMKAFHLHLRRLASAGEVRLSDHVYDEMLSDNLKTEEVRSGIADSTIVEYYPDYPKGPCILLLQRDESGLPVHVLRRIARGMESPAVVVTVYRPAPERWASDFLRRLP